MLERLNAPAALACELCRLVWMEPTAEKTRRGRTRSDLLFISATPILNFCNDLPLITPPNLFLKARYVNFTRSFPAAWCNLKSSNSSRFLSGPRNTRCQRTGISRHLISSNLVADSIFWTVRTHQADAGTDLDPRYVVRHSCSRPPLLLEGLEGAGSTAAAISPERVVKLSLLTPTGSSGWDDTTATHAT